MSIKNNWNVVIPAKSRADARVISKFVKEHLGKRMQNTSTVVKQESPPKRKEIYQYLIVNGQRRGIFVARRSNKGMLKIGYSACHPSDFFDLKEGLNIARQGSTQFFIGLQNRIRPEWSDSFNTFVERAKRYFKDATFPPAH